MDENNIPQKKTFRDKSSYISEEGKRVWIYAKPPKGKLYNFRMLLGYFLASLFFIGPFIKVGGNPLFLINIIERKFIIFSKIFWPQDFYVFFIAMISFIIFIVLFTVVYGRIWCGWACPQTVFMELFFRKIENLIEGSPIQQKKLDEQKMTFNKFFRKTLKHTIFWIIAFLIANTILSYIIGKENVFSLYQDNFSEVKFKILGIIAFSLVIYLVFSKLRELACTIICPYGRLQGVFLDRNSIAVSYDFKRGEPRGKTSENKFGDCIDCGGCVQVCQQGIDIRNGIQLECTNCSACIDACNSVMNKINKPLGLIRYSSLENIEKGEKFKFTPRIIAYSIVLTFLLSFLIILLAGRTSVETTILRTPGTTFQFQDDGKISNLYNIKIINKTHNNFEVEIKLINENGEIQMAGSENLVVKDENSAEGVFFVIMENNFNEKSEIPLEIGIFIENKLIETKKINFICK